MQTQGGGTLDEPGRSAIANVIRRAEHFDQKFQIKLFFPIAKTPPAAKGLRGTGGAAETLAAKRGNLPLRRYGRSIFSQLRAMVLNDFQIAN